MNLDPGRYAQHRNSIPQGFTDIACSTITPGKQQQIHIGGQQRLSSRTGVFRGTERMLGLTENTGAKSQLLCQIAAHITGPGEDFQIQPLQQGQRGSRALLSTRHRAERQRLTRHLFAVTALERYTATHTGQWVDDQSQTKTHDADSSSSPKPINCCS